MERPAGKVGAKQIGKRRGAGAGLVTDNADDPRVGANADGHGFARAANRLVGRLERPVAPGGSRLVHDQRVGNAGGVKPEAERPAGHAVTVAIERRARCIQETIVRWDERLEAQSQLVVAIGATAVAAVGHLGIEGVVARARDGDEVRAGVHVEADEGVAAVVVVVTGHQRANAADLAEEREHGVEPTRDGLTGSGDDRLGSEPAGFRDVEPVGIDVTAAGGIELRQVADVVIARKDGLARKCFTHDRGQIVRVREPKRVTDFVHRDLEPGATVLACAPV